MSPHPLNVRHSVKDNSAPRNWRILCKTETSVAVTKEVGDEFRFEVASHPDAQRLGALPDVHARGRGRDRAARATAFHEARTAMPALRVDPGRGVHSAAGQNRGVAISSNYVVYSGDRTWGETKNNKGNSGDLEGIAGTRP